MQDPNIPTIELVESIDSQQVIELVRKTTLRGDPAARVYERSSIEVRPVAIRDLHPVATYVLLRNLQFSADLKAAFQTLDIDVDQLPGAIDYRWAGEQFRIAPPVVEVDSDGKTLLLVDGLHRVWRARLAGATSISAIVISDAALPLMCLPLQWDEVHALDAVPESRHRLRFGGIEEMLTAFPQFRDTLNADNAAYFLYRDLSMLGSGGPRAGTG